MKREHEQNIVGLHLKVSICPLTFRSVAQGVARDIPKCDSHNFTIMSMHIQEDLCVQSEHKKISSVTNLLVNHDAGKIHFLCSLNSLAAFN